MYKNITTIFSGIIIASFVLFHTDMVLAEQPPAYFSTSFYGGDIAKHRDDEKFREDWQLRDDAFIGGIEHLKLRYPLKEDWLFKSEIKTLPGQRNHNLKLEVSKNNLFYARIHYKRFPHYYDDSGGVYKNFSTPFFVIPEEPISERKSILLEFGLTLPDLPVFTFSYENKHRNGEISSLTWGQATEGGVNRMIVPTIKEVNDNINIIKIGSEYKHDIVNIEVEQRWEFTDLESVRTEKNFTNGVPTTASAKVVDEKDTYFESSQTTVKLSKTINRKLSLSGGYRYIKIDNDSEQFVKTFRDTGAVNTDSRNWSDPNSDSDVNSHLWNVNILSKPLKDLTVQGFLRLKNIHRDSISTWVDRTAVHDITARTNNTTFGEGIRVTYKRIPRIAPYLEAEWQQGDIEIKEKENGNSGFFQRDTDRDYDKQTYTAGIGFYPFRKFSGSVQYRKIFKKNEYDDDLDTESNTNPLDTAGYSAFIDKQDFDTDIYTTRLTAHPLSSVSATFRHEYRGQEIESKMDGLNRERAHVDTQTFSGSVTITPFSNLYLTSMVMHQNLRVKTRARNDQAIQGAARAFEGDSTTFVNNAIFALNEKTEFSADYQVSLTDNYDENNINDLGLPLEHDYTMQSLTLGVKHKIRKNMTLWSRYSLYDFDESHISDIDNYTDHLFAIGGEIKFH
ncbi:MAG: hypothetical protein H8D23_01975 [Candidatus Brocadiales bacterium]|nr:hypothetical protein [Candidatus Brocadiales bacterium]